MREQYSARRAFHCILEACHLREWVWHTLDLRSDLRFATRPLGAVSIPPFAIAIRLSGYFARVLQVGTRSQPAQSKCLLVLLRHKRRRFVDVICRVQQGQRGRCRAMATISLRRIVAIEFGM